MQRFDSTEPLRRPLPLRAIFGALALPLLAAGAEAQIQGDFNGDGRSDLAVGTPYASVGGVYRAGEIQVHYGIGDALSSTVVLVLNQASSGIDGSPEASDEFGAALASGDFNDDGYDDLLVGVPGDDGGGEEEAGSIHVIYGSFLGLSPASSERITEARLGRSSEQGDRFGSALACGDFNGDGFDDAAVGTPYEDVSGIDNAGAVVVIFGSEDGLELTGSERLVQGASGMAGVAETNDFFGAALAAGQFNQGDEEDLVIGAWGEDKSGYSNSGSVIVVMGSGGGPNRSSSVEWTRETEGVIGEHQTNAWFGETLCVANFDGRNYDDLAIGAPGSRMAGAEGAGSVSILYSASTGGLTADGDAFLHQNVTGMRDSCEAGDSFGAALAAGHFDDDNIADLAIGVPYEDRGSATNCGIVHVLYGTRRGLSPRGSQHFHQNSPGIVGENESIDFLGTTLAAGDFNDSGVDDLAIGVPLEDVSGVTDAGAINVVYGRASGLSYVDNHMLFRDGTSLSDQRFASALASAR